LYKAKGKAAFFKGYNQNHNGQGNGGTRHSGQGKHKGRCVVATGFPQTREHLISSQWRVATAGPPVQARSPAGSRGAVINIQNLQVFYTPVGVARAWCTGQARPKMAFVSNRVRRGAARSANSAVGACSAQANKCVRQVGSAAMSPRGAGEWRGAQANVPTKNPGAASAEAG